LAGQTEHAVIRRIIEPDCVAVIGASEDTSKYGGRVIDHLLKHGYPGRILPVNSSRQTIFGLPALASVRDADCPVDVALLAVPEAMLEETVADCAAVHAGCCVIIASGLGEKDEAGRLRQAELVRIARAGGTRILGPNCLGYVSPHRNLAITPSFAMNVPSLPRGRVALLSQSGALMATMFARGADNGAGFRACVSFGNQADLVFEDFLDFFADDEGTAAIALYAEEIRDSGRFFAACDRARAAGKFVIVCKAGSSPAGSGTSLSHTASIAGDVTVFAALCARHQVLLTDDPDTAAAGATAVAKWGIGHGRRVAVISGSGGGVVTAADYLTRRGFEVPRLEARSTLAISRYYATFSGYAAVDYGALPPAMKGREAWIGALQEIVGILAEDVHVDAIVYLMTAQPLMTNIAGLIADLAQRAGKPVLLCLTAGSAAEHVRAVLRERRSLFADRINEVALLLDLLAQPRLDTSDFTCDAMPPSMLPAASVATDGEARDILRSLGVAVAPERTVASMEQARAAARDLGYPVVLKADCRGMVHKSELGLVKVGLRNADDLRAAWRGFDTATADPGVASQVAGRVLQQQVEGAVELFVGARWAAGLGTVVIVGFGGVYVELVGDSALRAAPVSPSGALRMLRSLRLWPLFEGARGCVPLDADAAALVISKISQFAAAAGSRLDALDVNPLMVMPKGRGAVVVDCRMSLDNLTQTE